MDYDALELCAPSWENLITAQNAKQGNQSHVSRPGEGPNCKQVRAKTRQNRVKEKSRNVQQSIEDIRREKKNRKLCLCGAKCPETGFYCRKECLSEDGLKQHDNRGHHDFPPINATDWTALKAGKAGGSLALGSRPNRRSHNLFEEIAPANPGSQSEVAAQCYQSFNRRDVVESMPKTDAQVCFLLRCFGAKDKLNPSQTMEKMKTEIDPADGGLMFCSSKAHLQINGSVLTEEQIASWQSQEVKKRDNDKMSGAEKMNSLMKHLKDFEDFKQKNPSNYWRVYNDEGKAIAKSKTLSTMLYLFDIPGSSLNVAEKRSKLQELDFDESRVDAKLSEVSSRIELYRVSIEASKGISQGAEAHQARLEAESNRILALENARTGR